MSNYPHHFTTAECDSWDAINDNHPRDDWREAHNDLLAKDLLTLLERKADRGTLLRQSSRGNEGLGRRGGGRETEPGS